MCTGRIDLAFLLRAFSRGADGVFIAGCHLNECNYLTHGNFYALGVTRLGQRLLEHAGIRPERLEIMFVSGGEAQRFVTLVDGFAERVRELGPLAGDGADPAAPGARLAELARLVPYLKVQLRDKLLARLPRREEYDTLYSREELDDLLDAVVSYHIDPKRCQACMVCAKRCPVAAIEGGKGRIHVIDQSVCIKCGRCREVCPPRFAAVQALRGVPVPPPLPPEERVLDRKRKGR